MKLTEALGLFTLAFGTCGVFQCGPGWFGCHREAAEEHARRWAERTEPTSGAPVPSAKLESVSCNRYEEGNHVPCTLRFEGESMPRSYGCPGFSYFGTNDDDQCEPMVTVRRIR